MREAAYCPFGKPKRLSLTAQYVRRRNDEVSHNRNTNSCHDAISIPTHEEGDMRKHPLYPSRVTEVPLILSIISNSTVRAKEHVLEGHTIEVFDKS